MLTAGNIKVAALNFSLPPGLTCPGSTPECRARCYARKTGGGPEGPGYSPEARALWAANYRATKEPGFVAAMTAELTGKTSRARSAFRRRFIRLHCAGDFYSQRYLEAWYEIAQACPDVRFLAFSKSFALDWRGRPGNLQVVWSVFPDTDHGTIPPGPRAYAGEVVDYGDRRVARAQQCAGRCEGCGICWYLTGDVRFHMH